MIIAVYIIGFIATFMLCAFVFNDDSTQDIFPDFLRALAASALWPFMWIYTIIGAIKSCVSKK